MRTKRSVAMAVVAAFCLVVLSACGSSGSDSPENLAFSQLPDCPLDALDKATKPVEISMWTDSVIESFKALEELAAQFNKSQDQVHVTIVRPFGDKTVPANLHSSFFGTGAASSEPPAQPTTTIQPGLQRPAIIQFDSFRLREVADSNKVLPAQSCINASKFDTSGILPAAKAYYSIGGVQWPAYMLPAMLIMIFNAQQFTKAGLDPAKPPRTLAELEDAARKLKASGVAHPISLPNDPNIIESWITGSGATLVSDGNGRDASPQRATFYTQSAVDVLTRVQRMMREGLIAFTDEPDGSITHLLKLATGESTLTFETSASTTSIAAVIEGNQQATEEAQKLNGGGGLGGVVTTDFRAAPLPGVRQAGQASIGGFAWYLTSEVPPEQQAAAWKFIEYVYKPENQFAMLTKFGALPLTKEAASQKSVTDWLSGKRIAPSWLKVASEQFRSADPALPGPLIGPYEDFLDLIAGILRQLPKPDSPAPSQLLTQAENQLTAELGNYNTLHG